MLRFVRGEVIRRHLRDPKTAREDFDAATADAPRWLRQDLQDARSANALEAEKSRKRKPAVAPAPSFAGIPDMDVPGPPAGYRAADEPAVWALVQEIIRSPDPRRLPS